MGLVELGNVALDGTKVHPDGCRDRKHKAMSYERMLEEAEATDREEDERFG